jgi:8-oxo-dGTP pyrophosphatase MutT (NUDIX family)
MPGGAIHDGESPEQAARREAEEEIGGSIPPYRVTGMEVQDCGGGWKFHIVTADVGSPFTAYSVQETDATGWFTQKEMRSLPLHPGFQQWLRRGEEGLSWEAAW